MQKTLVKRLQEETGEGIGNCSKALTLTGDDFDVAKEFLRLRSQAFSRRKRENGVLVSWEVEDYLREARRIVKESKQEALQNE